MGASTGFRRTRPGSRSLRAPPPACSSPRAAPVDGGRRRDSNRRQRHRARLPHRSRSIAVPAGTVRCRSTTRARTSMSDRRAASARGGLPLRSDGFTVNEEAIRAPNRARSAPAARAGPRTSTSPAARALRAVLQHGGPLHGGHAHDAGRALMRRPAISVRSPPGAAGRSSRSSSRSRSSRRSAVDPLDPATSRSQNRATVVEIAGRQRTLAERYVKEVLLVRAGEQAAIRP